MTTANVATPPRRGPEPAPSASALGRLLRRVAAATGLLALVLVALSFVPERVPATGAWLARAGLQARFESVDGLPIRYVRAGNGAPVVLIHGFGSSIYTWQDVLPALAREHDVVALDLPGFGGSGVPQPVSAERLPRAVLGLLDRLGLRRVSLAGNSLGGATALWIAASEPERVDRLVLIDSAGFQLGPGERPLLLRALALPGASLASRLPIVRLATWLSLRSTFFDPGLVTRERLDEYTAPSLRPGAARAVIALARQPDPTAGGFERLLGRVRAPTLVVWGREDRWIPVADARRFGEALAEARVVVLEDCGHLPQEERPADLARLMLGFLAVAPVS